MQIKQKQYKTKLKNKKSLKNHKNQCKIQNRRHCFELKVKSGKEEMNAECKMQNAELGKRGKGKGKPQ